MMRLPSDKKAEKIEKIFQKTFIFLQKEVFNRRLHLISTAIIWNEGDLKCATGINRLISDRFASFLDFPHLEI